MQILFPVDEEYFDEEYKSLNPFPVEVHYISLTHFLWRLITKY